MKYYTLRTSYGLWVIREREVTGVYKVTETLTKDGWTASWHLCSENRKDLRPLWIQPGDVFRTGNEGSFVLEDLYLIPGRGWQASGVLRGTKYGSMRGWFLEEELIEMNFI